MFLNVKGQRALVVGDGTLAARKADLLVRAGCDLTVIAPAPNKDLPACCKNSRSPTRRAIWARTISTIA